MRVPGGRSASHSTKRMLAGTAEGNILGLQFDLHGITLAVEDEELGGAVVLRRVALCATIAAAARAGSNWEIE